MWKLEEALEVIRAIQPAIRKFGYHLCLGGGVLNTGMSRKDLDLYFLPMHPGSVAGQPKLLAWLEGMWGPAEQMGGGRVVAQPAGQFGIIISAAGADYPDDPIVRWKGKFNYTGLRIDVFILGVASDAVVEESAAGAAGADMTALDAILRENYEGGVVDALNHADALYDFSVSQRRFMTDRQGIGEMAPVPETAWTEARWAASVAIPRPLTYRDVAYGDIPIVAPTPTSTAGATYWYVNANGERVPVGPPVGRRNNDPE